MEVDLAWLHDAEDSERAEQLNGEIIELSGVHEPQRLLPRGMSFDNREAAPRLVLRVATRAPWPGPS